MPLKPDRNPLEDGRPLAGSSQVDEATGRS
jgi:hypothetical protein